MGKEFDPDKFIDREYEQRLFAEILEFASSARILAIRDSGGTGKSKLLEHFQYRCRTGKPRIPVSLIILDQLHDYSPLSLIKVIAGHLSIFGIKFENFERYETARVDADFKTIRASAYLQGSNFSGAQDVKISAVMTNLGHAETVNVSTAITRLSPEQEQTAQDIVIRAFFDDLHAYCSGNPVVVMLDTFEKCEANLKSWIVSHFLERNFFTDSCDSCFLTLVVAGKEVPEFRLHWSKEDCDSMLRLVTELGRWSKENVEACMLAHGFDKVESEEIEIFHGLIKMGIPPSQLVQAIQTALAVRRGQQ